MRSPQRLRLGSVLSLRLRIPTEISGTPFSASNGTGRVVSEHQLEDGSLGYRVTIERSPAEISKILF